MEQHAAQARALRERLRCASDTITLGTLAHFSHFRHFLLFNPYAASRFDPIIRDHHRFGAVGFNSYNPNLTNFSPMNEKLLTVAPFQYSRVIENLEFVPGLQAGHISGGKDNLIAGKGGDESVPGLFLNGPTNTFAHFCKQIAYRFV
jgi:hypothetical protein